MMNVDLYLFNAINGQAKKSKILDIFAIFFAEYAGYLGLVFLLVFAFIIQSWQVFLIPVTVGLVARLFINEMVYAFWKRKRPLEVLSINSLIKKPNHPAFPSGHSAFFFGVAFGLFLFSVPLAVAFVVLTSLVVLSRIFCGVHWPSDILAGIGSALLAFLIVGVMVK